MAIFDDDEVLLDSEETDAPVTTMTVSEFVRHVNGILKRGLGSGVWVQEIGRAHV